jgi:hypothetical protein
MKLIAIFFLFLAMQPATAGARKGEICLKTANLGDIRYAKAVCGKDLGNPKQYACVFTDGTSSTCWKDGDCFVCAGDD